MASLTADGANTCTVRVARKCEARISGGLFVALHAARHPDALLRVVSVSLQDRRRWASHSAITCAFGCICDDDCKESLASYY